MATTLVSDLKIYQAQIEGGMAETTQQNTMAFNGASAGAIRLVNEYVKGQYGYESFFKATSSLVTRQDLTSTSAGTATKFTEDENISVKLNRRYQHEMSLAAMRIRNNGLDAGFFALGQQLAKEMMVEKLNRGLAAARVALANVAAVTNDITSATVATISHSALLDTLRKFGDASDRIRAWVMHSEQFFDLGIQGIDDDITNVADGVVRRVDVPGLGRPIVITDSASLINTSPSPDTYYVLGLAEGGINIQDQPIDNELERVTGLEQLTLRAQGEYAFNLSLKGFQWDVGNGGANPTDAAVATASYWDKVATSDKDLAGVVLACERLSDQ